MHIQGCDLEAFVLMCGMSVIAARYGHVRHDMCSAAALLASLASSGGIHAKYVRCWSQPLIRLHAAAQLTIGLA